MYTLKQLAQLMAAQLPHDMSTRGDNDEVSVWTGLNNHDRRFVLRVWRDHGQNKWRVWSAYGINAKFDLVSDALDNARSESYKLRAYGLI